MSDDGSPNLLNLRGFRIQKKPTFSHTAMTNGAFESSEELSAEINVQSVKECILPIEPDVECETTNEATLESNQKVIIVRQPEIAMHEIGSSAELMNSSRPIEFQYPSRQKKPQAVIEKEQQMRFLREKFPGVESMAVHDVLSKHNFDINKAIDELQEKQEKKVSKDEYTDWKLKQQQNEETKLSQEIFKMNVVQENQVQQPQQQQNVILNYVQVNRKRILPAVSNHAKKKAKRLKTDTVSDDSDAEGAVYKDNRVFDSDEDSDVEISNELTSDKKKVLEFFETATPNELQLMSSCSKKKATVIIKARPFKSWTDLVEKLQENKSVSTDLLNAAQDVLVTRHNVQSLMRKCKSLASQMERAVAAGAAGVKTQPSLLSPDKHLTNYQMVGLNWLAVLHTQGVNGILADEMGLGKTIQVIAFLAHLKEIGATKGIPHLIVVPSSTLDNWRVEFEKWCPSMKLFMYYGSTEERKMYRIDYWASGRITEYDVIITTYSMVTNSSEERKMFRVTQTHYLIFDEAHMLKNMNTQRYANLIRIKAYSRILLTGTPLQNNLLELMSLLIFVMPAMFAGKTDDLKSLFSKNSKSNEDDLPPFEKNQVKHAKDIMKPFVLRRLKQDVLQDLPIKTDELVEVPLAPTQLEQYQNLVSHFQNIGKEPSEHGTCSAMTMMSDLRKLSNHPLLLKYYYQYEDLIEMAKVLAVEPLYKEKVEQYIVDDLSCMSDFEIHSLCKEFKDLNKFELPDNLVLTSGKFLFLDRKLEELKANGNRVLIFSQYVIMLNVMEAYLNIRNYSYMRLDGSTPVTVRQELIDQFTADPSVFIFLLSTRAGGLGINLTAADTVIIHDIDFNPYNDKQAEDRCHRMGQQKPVQVYRLISERTIEEGMWQMNQEKLKLEKELTAEEAENPDVKSVVRLLSSVLGINNENMTRLVDVNSAIKSS